MTLFFLLFPFLVAVLIVTAFRRVRPRAALVVSGAMLGWFTLAGALSFAGAFSDFSALPPRVPMMAFAAIAAGCLLARAPSVREALDAMPSWWVVALQGFRFPLELALYSLCVKGLMPAQMTFEGRNLDVLVGVSAPVLAWLMATGRASRWVQLAWQVGAIGLLVNVVAIAITSAPGPLRADWPGEPLTVVAQWPYVLLPGFLVPVAALGHLAGLRRWVREARALRLA